MSSPPAPPALPQRLRLGQRLAKLGSMSWPELATRAQYAAYRAWESREHARGGFQRRNRLPRALASSIGAADGWVRRVLIERRTRPRPWFAGVDADRRTEVVAAFASRFTQERARAVAEGDRVLEGDVSFFGKRFHCTPDTDWHQDPVTGRRWPAVYHAHVPVGAGDVGFGDVKHVWELNRHQFFVDLAKATLLTGDLRYTKRLLDLHTSWCEQNPYGTGVNWACALEPAFRTVSWLWAYAMVGDHLAVEQHERWLTAFYDHGRFLYHHLEHYTSPFNHLIGEASALFLLGSLLPELADAPRWEARGRRVLERSVGAQFHRDGGSVEQSTFYHHATLGFYLLAMVVAERGAAPLSASVRGAVERGLEFSMHLRQPDGRTPAIGGADDGKPIRLEVLPLWDFRPYLAIGAVLFERGDFKTAAGRFWEDALWLLGPESLTTFDLLEASAPAPSVALPASGYVVLRQGDPGATDYVCFDCGPQAAGLRRDNTPSAAHGHADCLSVVVWLAGRPVLVDSGFYCYNGHPAWEVHFRRTRAHSTVEIDRTDQAQHLSKMAWCRTYEAVLEGWSAGDSGGWARASHDGYERLTEPVRHRRTVCLRPLDYLIVLDELTGRGRHVMTAHFQFAPGDTDLEADEQRLAVGGHALCMWAATARVQPTVVDGVVGAPDGGWIAPSLEVAVPAPHLRLDATDVAFPGSVVTVIGSHADGLRTTPLARTPEGLILEMRKADTVEWIEISDLVQGQLATVLIWRREGAGLVGESCDGRRAARQAPESIQAAGVTC